MLGVPMLGSYRSGRQDAGWVPPLQAGPLVYAGPGATDAVRAIALAILGSSDTDLDLPPGHDPIGVLMVLIDQQLARELLGARPEQQLPGWLHLADSPQAAVSQFHAIARRHAAAGIDADHYVATEQEPLTVLIARTDPALHQSVVQACLTDPTGGLDAVLLGNAPDAKNTTTVVVDQDGVVTAATGPRGQEIRGLTLFTTNRDLAADLFAVLYAAREIYRKPPAPPHPPDPPVHDAAQPDHAAPPAETAATTHTPPDNQAGTPPGPSAPPPAANDPYIRADTPLLLRVLGPIDILGPRQGPTAVRGERNRDILALLALHPEGLSPSRIADLVWNQSLRSEREQKQNVYTARQRALTQLRAAAKTASPKPAEDTNEYIVLGPTERYRLDPALVTTDLHLRDRLEHQADRAQEPAQRLRLLAQAAGLHRGPLADGLDEDRRDWLTTARYQQQLHAARLHLRIADLAADTDPATALDHLKQALDHATDDEHTTAEATRLYRQLGRDDLSRALQPRHGH
ncbi:MAG: AfsR/SARP family transcriptional regulator, partial [Sciscionella sp.]